MATSGANLTAAVESIRRKELTYSQASKKFKITTKKLFEAVAEGQSPTQKGKKKKRQTLAAVPKAPRSPISTPPSSSGGDYFPYSMEVDPVLPGKTPNFGHWIISSLSPSKVAELKQPDFFSGSEVKDYLVVCAEEIENGTVNCPPEWSNVSLAPLPSNNQRRATSATPYGRRSIKRVQQETEDDSDEDEIPVKKVPPRKRGRSRI